MTFESHWCAGEPVSWRQESAAAAGEAVLLLPLRGAWRERDGDSFSTLVDRVSVSFRIPDRRTWVSHLGVDRFDVVAFPDSTPGFAQHPHPALISIPTAVAHGELIAARRRRLPPAEVSARARRLAVSAGRDLLLAHTPADEIPPSQRKVVEVARLALSRGTAVAPGVSRSHASRAFHRLTGLTMTQYQRRMRLVTAIRAIASVDRGFANIAAASGFADHAHLTRSVRDAIGLTPAQLRDRFRAG
ncbi:helix-turn-helix domain-containing protein [Amycolatopsis sp. NPDC088138]|uniref:helix-turn-helix domain-containing protein n=1 Tax=Amycolatopsis sp. NPDC088138 TaxID=3363938 RepID=UPI003800A4D6